MRFERNYNHMGNQTAQVQLPAVSLQIMNNLDAALEAISAASGTLSQHASTLATILSQAQRTTADVTSPSSNHGQFVLALQSTSSAVFTDGQHASSLLSSSSSSLSSLSSSSSHPLASASNAWLQLQPALLQCTECVANPSSYTPDQLDALQQQASAFIVALTQLSSFFSGVAGSIAQASSSFNPQVCASNIDPNAPTNASFDPSANGGNTGNGGGGGGGEGGSAG